MADVMKVTLQAELEKAKETLKDVDENIKKLTGRDPNELRQGPGGPLNVRRPSQGAGLTGGDFRGRERFIPPTSWRETGGLDGPPAKRRSFGGAFSRLGPRVDSRRLRGGEDSGDEDELPRKLTVQSSVVATPKDTKTRKDCLEEQKSDSKGLARNRRMFGLLLGTLQKFKAEETKKHDKEVKRFEIEKKLEDAAEKEKEDLKKERYELFVERRRRQAQLRRLEQKMDLVKQQEEWEAHHRQLMGFIQTKTKPPLFYLPAKHTLVTQDRLKESRKRAEAMLARRRLQTEEELKALDWCRTPFDESGDQAEVEEEPGLLEDEQVVPDELEQVDEMMDIVGSLEQEDEKENHPEAGNLIEDEEDSKALCGVVRVAGITIKTEVNQDGETAATVVVVPAAAATAANGLSEIAPLTSQELEAEVEKDGDAEDPYSIDHALLTEKEFEPIYD